MTALKTLVKMSLGAAASRLPPVQEALEQSLTIFLYHDVTDAPARFSRECGLVTGRRPFERQLQWIADTFHVISLDALLAGECVRRAALITFDDGLASVVREALPILRRFRLPSTVFLNMAPVAGEPFWPARAVHLCRHVEGFLPWLTERLGGGTLESPHLACTPALIAEWEARHGDEDLQTLPQYLGSFATPEDLEAAARDPLVTFGNHLYRHYNMLTLSEAELEAEVRANAQALAAYGCARPVLAFPFGHGVSDRHMSLLSAWGLERFFTGASRLNRDPGAPLLHRISMTSWHDRPSRLWFQVARAALLRQGFAAAAPKLAERRRAALERGVVS